MEKLDELSRELEIALLSLNRPAATEILSRTNGTFNPVELVEGTVSPALERIGIGWEQGTVALSQVYMSSRICEDLLDSILPPDSPGRRNQPRLAIAVLEDYHALGKRIVYSVLRASGFELLDYGHGLSVTDLAGHVGDDNIDVLLVSTLMLRAALKVRDLRETLDDRGLNTKLVVGGAPFRFDEELWKEVRADAFGHNAAEALVAVSVVAGGG